MREKINEILDKIQTARQWVFVKSAPLRDLWNRMLTPLKPILDPLAMKWAELTAPLRARWSVFKNQYPRAGSVLGWTGTAFRWGVNFLIFLIAGVWIGLFGRLPSSEELRNIETANATEVYSADSVLIGKYYMGENRTQVSLDNISPYIINALIATEDKRFLEHSGIDFTSLLRVGFGVISGKGMGGGSTLSQQLA
ncbi:MAG: transglycosylase domain-containing protein, partial [Bacteroidota bacterium]